MQFSPSVSSLLRSGAIVAAGLAALICAAPVFAKPEYAAREKQKCLYCHERPGQARNFRGLFYAAHGRTFEEFDNVYEAKAAGVQPDAMGPDAMPKKPGYPKVAAPPALNFVLKDIEGKPVHLGRYQGAVALVVNMASFCGN